MSRYRVITPNLLRRRDRWLVFAGTMIGQGVPPSRIQRFIAHDGDFYPDGETAHRNALELLRDKGREPKYLDAADGDPYNYCWHWSWYELLHSIAMLNDKAIPVLVVIDDWRMTIDYDTICEHVRNLRSKSEPFRGIQYAHDRIGSKRPPKTDLTPVADCAGIQYELVGGTDTAFMVSPSGARILLDFADKYPKCPPARLFYLFANEADQSGWYSSIERCARARPSGIIDDTQDRQALKA